MDSESQVIQGRIDETRASLAGKLEELGTMGATVGDRLEGAAASAGQAIDVVNDTVQAVKSGVVSMRESCSITKHVEKRPWTMLAGATALAFVGSSIQRRRSVFRTNSPKRGSSPAAARRARAEEPPAPRKDSRPQRPQPGAAQARGGGFGDVFRGEIAQLRGLALGMLFGVLRDALKDSVSKPVGQHVDDVIDGLTNRMGGKPVTGRMLPEREHPEPVSVMDRPEGAVPPEA